MDLELTELIHAWQAGRHGADDRLFERMFDRLHALAVIQIAKESRSASSLQATELVSEGVIRLMKHVPAAIVDREHFVAIAGCAMKQALAEKGRRRDAEKRPPEAHRTELVTDLKDLTRYPEDLIDLCRALDRLERLDAHQASIARMHLLGEFTLQDCAQRLGLSHSKIKRDWRGARLWLHRELEDYLGSGIHGS